MLMRPHLTSQKAWNRKWDCNSGSIGTYSNRNRNNIRVKQKVANPTTVLLIVLLSSISSNLFASALVNCTFGDPVLGDARCVEKYRDGSVCAEHGFCSNPFRSGCLNNILASSDHETNFHRLRACNSEDDPGAEERGECVAGDYEEVRILSQDWEAPMMTSWIMQIILSEVLGVPTTLETSKPDSEASMNFYDPDMRFSYSNNTYVSEVPSIWTTWSSSWEWCSIAYG